MGMTRKAPAAGNENVNFVVRRISPYLRAALVTGF